MITRPAPVVMTGAAAVVLIVSVVRAVIARLSVQPRRLASL